MVEYKYVVIDNDPAFPVKTFDTIEEALIYAKEGSSPFIYEYVATEDGIDESTEELVWNWDDIWDDDETVISRIKSRHSDVAEDFKIEIEKTPEEVDIRTSGDEAQELMDFARAILGDNFDVFDCDFAECENCEYPEDEEVAPAEFDYEVEEPVTDDVTDINPFEGSFVTKEEPVEAEVSVEEIPEEEKELVAEIENTPADESPKDMINGKLVDAKNSEESEVEVEESLIEEKEEAPELKGTDNAVVDCQTKQKVITHSEDEKPLDCNTKKKPLEKPLAEAKKEEDELPPDPNAVKVEVHRMLNDLVADEIEAINGYEAVKTELMDKPIAHKDEIVNTLDHIKGEETEHIDELIDAAAEIPFEDDPGEPLEEPVADAKFDEPIEEDLGFVPFDSDVRVGDKIRILHLEGEDNRYDGKEGTVETVDGIGQLHGTWGGLAVIPGIDEFEVIPNTKGNLEEMWENFWQLNETAPAKKLEPSEFSKAVSKIKDAKSKKAAVTALRAGDLKTVKQLLGEGTTAEFVNEDVEEFDDFDTSIQSYESSEVDESLEGEDDLSDEEFIEAFGKEIASKYKPVNE